MALRVKNLEVSELTAPEIDALFSRLIKKVFADSKSDSITINILFVGDIVIPKPRALKLVFECAATIGFARVRQMLSAVHQGTSPVPSPLFPTAPKASSPTKRLDTTPRVLPATSNIGPVSMTSISTTNMIPSRPNPILLRDPPHPIFASSQSTTSSSELPMPLDSPPKIHRKKPQPRRLDVAAIRAPPTPTLTAPKVQPTNTCAPTIQPQASPSTPDVRFSTCVEQLMILQSIGTKKLIADHTAKLLDNINSPNQSDGSIRMCIEAVDPPTPNIVQVDEQMVDANPSPIVNSMLCLPAPDPEPPTEIAKPVAPLTVTDQPQTTNFVPSSDSAFSCCSNQTATPIARPSGTTLVDLRCGICSKLTHHKCLVNPAVVHPRPLPGDTTYTFTCSRCSSSNSETFIHGAKAWVDVTRLAIYNLWLNNDGARELFKYKEEIVKYIDEHWDLICFPKTRTPTWPCNVGGVLSRFADCFKSGTTQIGHPGWWGLTSYSNFVLRGFISGRPRQTNKDDTHRMKPKRVIESDESDDDIMVIDEEIKNTIKHKTPTDNPNIDVDTTPVSKRPPYTFKQYNPSTRHVRLTIPQLMRVGLVKTGDVIIHGSHSTAVRPSGKIGDKSTCITNSPSKWVNHITDGKLKNGWSSKLRRGSVYYSMKSIREQYFEKLKSE